MRISMGKNAERATPVKSHPRAGLDGRHRHRVSCWRETTRCLKASLAVARKSRKTFLVERSWRQSAPRWRPIGPVSKVCGGIRNGRATVESVRRRDERVQLPAKWSCPHLHPRGQRQTFPWVRPEDADLRNRECSEQHRDIWRLRGCCSRRTYIFRPAGGTRLKTRCHARK
jgi:hypothetical protein